MTLSGASRFVRNALCQEGHGSLIALLGGPDPHAQVRRLQSRREGIYHAVGSQFRESREQGLLVVPTRGPWQLRSGRILPHEHTCDQRGDGPAHRIGQHWALIVVSYHATRKPGDKDDGTRQIVRRVPVPTRALTPFLFRDY